MRSKAGRMLAATALLATLASCGGGGSDKTETTEPPVDARGGSPTSTGPDALATVKQAVATTKKAGPALFAGSFFFDAGALGTDDPAGGSVTLASPSSATYDVDMKAETDGLVAPGTPADQVVLHVRDTGDALYLQFPAAFTSAGVGDRWVRIPPVAAPTGVETPPGFEQVSGRVFLAARLLRPASCFDVLERVTSAEKVGTDSVRGKAATRYALQWAPRTWVEDTGLFFFFGKNRSAARLAAIDGALAKATTADVWIDELGRVRKVVATSDLTVVAPFFDPPGDPAMWRELRTECEFYDFGTSVPAVRVPAAVVTPAGAG
jgi:hypothetical protein